MICTDKASVVKKDISNFIFCRNGNQGMAINRLTVNLTAFVLISNVPGNIYSQIDLNERICSVFKKQFAAFLECMYACVRLVKRQSHRRLTSAACC